MKLKTMKSIAYFIVFISITIAMYPFLENTFYTTKYTEIAILGSTGIIGDYTYEVPLGDEFSLQIFLENHENQFKLYKTEIKLVDFFELNNSPPFKVDSVASYLNVIENNANEVFPVRIEMEKPFYGKLVAELYIYDAVENIYHYHDRWVSIWIKTIE